MEKENNNAQMSFLAHLEILRWHLVRSFIVIGVFTILAFVFKSILFDHIILAQKSNSFWTYRLLCKFSHFIGRGNALCISDVKFNLINITMSGQFTIHIVTSVIAGIILAFPYILYEIWRFISPALKKEERKYARITVFFGSVLFMLGILFGYYFISPLSIQFLGNYQVSELVQNQISLSSFISTVTTVTLSCGLVFQLPLLVYFLSRFGIVTPTFMKKYRKHAVIISLILSAIITPPDISSQLLLAVPLIVLYEFSIYLSKVVVKRS